MEMFDNTEFPMIRQANPRSLRVRWAAFRYRLIWTLFGHPSDGGPSKWRSRAMSVVFPCNHNGLVTRTRHFLCVVRKAWRAF